MRLAATLAFTTTLLFSAAVPARADEALYDALGKREGIVAFVDAAFVHIRADTRITHDFDEVNLDRLKRMLSDQLCVVAGGPCKYTGSDMRTVHKGVHVSQGDFDALVEDLQLGMDDTGVPFRIQNEFLALLAPMEREIVTR